MDYVIAALPRTGSTMMCGLLANNGAGRPTEHLNPDVRASPFAIAISQHVSTEAFLDSARRTGTVGGLFGTKLMMHWLPIVHACCSERHPDYAGMLRYLFPEARYIFLRRRDLPALAASYTIALETGEWRASDRDNAIEHQVSVEDMHRNLLWLSRCEAEWIDLLHQLDVTPYEIYYEDLVDSTRDSVIGLMEHLGACPSEMILDSGTERQREPTAVALKKQYIDWLLGYHDRWYADNQIGLSLR